MGEQTKWSYFDSITIKNGYFLVVRRLGLGFEWMISESLDCASLKRTGKSGNLKQACQNAIASANRMETGPVATDGTHLDELRAEISKLRKATTWLADRVIYGCQECPAIVECWTTDPDSGVEQLKPDITDGMCSSRLLKLAMNGGVHSA